MTATTRAAKPQVTHAREGVKVTWSLLSMGLPRSRSCSFQSRTVADMMLSGGPNPRETNPSASSVSPAFQAAERIRPPGLCSTFRADPSCCRWCPSTWPQSSLEFLTCFFAERHVVGFCLPSTCRQHTINGPASPKGRISSLSRELGFQGGQLRSDGRMPSMSLDSC